MSESVKFPLEVIDLVQTDHTPRAIEVPVYEVRDRVEGALLRLERHVAFWDGVRVRTILEVDYVTEEARVVQEEAERQEARALRQTIIQTAQSAVGVRVDQLTAVQIRALYALTLFDIGALTNQGNVKPLAEWVKS